MAKLYILCGIPFSGKTIFAKEMVRILGVERIDLDEIKVEMFGPKIADKDLKQADWNRIYQEIYIRIDEGLRAGKSIVYDTGNFTKNERGIVRSIAEKIGGVEAVTIFINTPYTVARQRLSNNRNSKQRFNITDNEFEDAVHEMQIPGEDENTMVFDSTISEDQWIRENLQ